MILGGGPNRIGQGIEFDYCCCHASFALRELGIESIMVNSNPETVSTDYDTSDLLFFEPLTTEDVLNICDRVEPDGRDRAVRRADAAEPGPGPEQRRRADHRHQRRHDRGRRGPREVRERAGPAGAEAAGQRHRADLAQARARRRPRSAIPVLVRPSYVLGGRAMEICYDAAQFERFVAAAFVVAQGQPVLIDRFLEDAIEVDVDAIADGQQVIVGGVMEHIEEAGVHSGDSACVIPPYSLPAGGGRRDPPSHRAHWPGELQVKGLMNVQFAVKREDGRVRIVYVLEVNPRASRTVPFVSKATGMPLAKAAAKVMVGVSLAEQGYFEEPIPRSSRSRRRLSLRQVPRRRHRPRAGDEIDRRGDGHQRQLSHRLRQEPAGRRHRAARPRARSFISVANRDKEHVVELARRLDADGLRAAGHPRHGRAACRRAGIRGAEAS